MQGGGREGGGHKKQRGEEAREKEMSGRVRGGNEREVRGRSGGREVGDMGEVKRSKIL